MATTKYCEEGKAYFYYGTIINMNNNKITIQFDIGKIDIYDSCYVLPCDGSGRTRITIIRQADSGDK